MSFILDALKKSEGERQRQSGPALFEVKVAPPRHRYAVWAVGLGALLAVNLVVVGWLLWRGGASRAGTAGTAAASVSAAAAPSTVSAEPLAGPTRSVVGTQPSGTTQPSSVMQPGAAAQPSVTVPTAMAASSAAGGVPGTATASPPTAAANIGRSGGAYAPADSAETGTNPDDLAPAVEPRRQMPQPTGQAMGEPPGERQSGVIRATASGLPTYQDAAAQPGANIPDLKLDLHVYSPQPDQRFVFLNMMKLHEGDTTPKGVRVERITQDGVILSYQGREFVLLKP